MIKASDLFEIPTGFKFSSYFNLDLHPWEWVPIIKDVLEGIEFPKLPFISNGVYIGEKVYIHPSVRLPAYACIEGPAYIDEGTQIRPGAYIRQNVIIGKNCVIGNSCEYKNCMLIENVQTAHFNYVGDSILGTGSHMGAGSILANLRLDEGLIRLKGPDNQKVETSLRKLGSLVGDGSQIGCNAVLQPGSILGKKSYIMPAIAFRGYLGPGLIAK